MITRIERNNAKIEQLGSYVENESSDSFSTGSWSRLQQLEKNNKIDLENTKKEVAALERQVENKEKKQTWVNQLSASLAEKVEKRNTMEERLNSSENSL